ncbi:MAG: glycosyltransferase family 39 protein [Candidatus Hodarchaeales archaeon]
MAVPDSDRHRKRASWNSVKNILLDEHVGQKKLLAALGVATLFHIALSLLTKSPTVFVTAVHTARQILDGKMLYKDVTSPPTTGYAAWPPVFPYSLAIWFFFFGQSEFAAKMFGVATTIIAGYLCYLVGKDFLTPKQAYYAMLLFLFNPYTMLISLGGHFENYALIFFLLTLLLLQKNHVGLGGIALGIGIMVKLFPGLLLFAILPFWAARREYSASFLFLVAITITVGLIALPFLLICPDDFIYWVFEFHSERDTGGVSIYYYWLPWLFQASRLILALQALLLFSCACVVYILTKKYQSISLATILILWMPLILVLFFSSTRILYPRYLAILIPFLSWQTAVLWAKATRRGAILDQLLIYLSMLGTIVWTLPWELENHHPASFTPTISLNNPLGLLYWIGAAIFDLTLFLFLALNIWLARGYLINTAEKTANGLRPR